MHFAEQLKAIRKAKGLSQEELAEMLGVSRQAVSKWEQGTGYPEMETLVLLAKTLGVTVDSLLCGASPAAPLAPERPGTGKIAIKAQNGKSIVHCHKVLSISVSKSTAAVPHYALLGVDSASLLGEHRTLLGWYTDSDAVAKEIDAILAALGRGEPSYQLQYNAKVKQTFWSVQLAEETE